MEAARPGRLKPKCVLSLPSPALENTKKTGQLCTSDDRQSPAPKGLPIVGQGSSSSSGPDERPPGDLTVQTHSSHSRSPVGDWITFAILPRKDAAPRQATQPLGGEGDKHAHL